MKIADKPRKQRKRIVLLSEWKKNSIFELKQFVKYTFVLANHWVIKTNNNQNLITKILEKSWLFSKN